MLRRPLIKICLVTLLLGGFFLVNVSEVLARRGPEPMSREPYPHHNPYWGRVVTLPELIAEVIIYSGTKYYYHQGYFYQKVPSGYIIIEAPQGAVVPALPLGYKTIIINGNNYYYYNDIYYLKAKKGYIVVSDPVYEVIELPEEVKVIEAPAKTEKNTVKDSKDVYTVNIPNSDGSYTAVKLKKSKDGFIGPQGEWYSDFPSVEQLKVMYGK